MPVRLDQAERVARQPNRRRVAPSHEDNTEGGGRRGHRERHGRDHPCRRRSPPLRRGHDGNVGKRYLRDDLDQPHRRVDPLEPARPRGRELHSVDALREMDNGLAGQNLARRRDRAQPRGQVQRTAPIAALGRHRLAGIQPHPDPDREDGSRPRSTACAAAAEAPPPPATPAAPTRTRTAPHRRAAPTARPRTPAPCLGRSRRTTPPGPTPPRRPAPS